MASDTLWNPCPNSSLLTPLNPATEYQVASNWRIILQVLNFNLLWTCLEISFIEEVKGFKSEKGSNKGFFQMTGPHRLVATDENFKFFELGSDEPISFAYKDIKGHKKQGRTYVIHTGRTTRSGRGEIDVDCKDHHVADQIYAIVSSNNFLNICLQQMNHFVI